MNRPTWDVYFLDIAATVATRSPCVKRQVGAVLVSEDRAILATGYNGPPRGAPHRDETTCVRIGIPSGERADVVCCAHAEINAIAQAARHGVAVKGSTLYVTTSPCAWCARSIVNAGVVRVVREGDYNDPVALNVFAESSVHVVALSRAQTTVTEHGVPLDPVLVAEMARLRERYVASDRSTQLARQDERERRSDDREAQHQELLAVHADLGDKVQELIDMKQARDNLAEHSCTITAELSIARNERDAWAAKANTSRMEAERETDRREEARARAECETARADRLAFEAVASLTAAGIAMPAEEPTAQGEIPMAVQALAGQRDKAAADLGSFVAAADVACGGEGTAAPERVLEKVASLRGHAQLAASHEGEIHDLEVWIKGEGSLGKGRVAKAVLKYAHDHEERVWKVADEKHRKLIDAVGDLAHASGIAWADADDATALAVLDALVTGEASMRRR